MADFAGEILRWVVESIVGSTGLTHIVMRADCTCDEKLEAWHDDFNVKCKTCGTIWEIPTDVQSEARRRDYNQRDEAARVRASAGGSGAMIPI